MTAILTITNKHVPSCGNPPKINPEGKRISYFQNQHGEQWFFISDDESQSGILTGGEVNWTEHLITWDAPLPDIILSTAETYWLYGCMFALFKKTNSEIMQRLTEGKEAHLDALKSKAKKK